jgi:ribosomal protein L29
VSLGTEWGARGKCIFLIAEAVTEVWQMKAEKIRNLTDEELSHQEREMNDQLFKLKFQLNMGQTESLKKIRGLRKDIARVKTIVRERAASGEKK